MVVLLISSAGPASDVTATGPEAETIGTLSETSKVFGVSEASAKKRKHARKRRTATTSPTLPTSSPTPPTISPTPPTPPPTTGGPALAVDILADRHQISADIYGINFADESLASELRLPVRRWGGNATTRYNWQYDIANHASDWYFENIPNDNPDPIKLPDGSETDRFVEQDRHTGTRTLLTVPLIGWTPDQRKQAYACGFNVNN
ncbi:MAG: hypothetical protein QOI57_2018, partial [Rubrobacteraceae bacterium]|nr:hypothetical protein [Rubrobacteraceae bacterium]